MGFLDQTQKIIEYNRGLLNDKSYLQDISKSPSKSVPSKIDIDKLEESALNQLEKNRKRNFARRIVMLTIGMLIVFTFLYSIFLL